MARFRDMFRNPGLEEDWYGMSSNPAKAQVATQAAAPSLPMAGNSSQVEPFRLNAPTFPKGPLVSGFQQGTSGSPNFGFPSPEAAFRAEPAFKRDVLSGGDRSAQVFTPMPAPQVPTLPAPGQQQVWGHEFMDPIVQGVQGAQKAVGDFDQYVMTPNEQLGGQRPISSLVGGLAGLADVVAGKSATESVSNALNIQKGMEQNFNAKAQQEKENKWKEAETQARAVSAAAAMLDAQNQMPIAKLNAASREKLGLMETNASILGHRIAAAATLKAAGMNNEAELAKQGKLMEYYRERDAMKDTQIYDTLRAKLKLDGGKGNRVAGALGAADYDLEKATPQQNDAALTVLQQHPEFATIQRQALARVRGGFALGQFAVPGTEDRSYTSKNFEDFTSALLQRQKDPAGFEKNFPVGSDKLKTFNNIRNLVTRSILEQAQVGLRTQRGLAKGPSQNEGDSGIDNNTLINGGQD